MKINGNLVFNSDASGELQNVYVERIAGGAAGASLPARLANAGSKGRMVFNTDNARFYYDDGTAWVSVATGDGTQAIQTELDNVEAALGTAINANGTFNAAAFNSFANVTKVAGAATATSLTQILSEMDSAIEGIDTLDEIFAATAAGNVIYATGAGPFSWAQAAPGSSSGVQPYDAELAALAGVTSAADKLPYFTGSGTADVTTLTSFARGLLDDTSSSDARTTLGVVIGTDVQAYDSGLGSLAAMAATAGIVTVDASGNVFTARSLEQPAAGLTISNTDGGGTMVFALANDLSALEGLTTSGIIVRTGDGTATTRSISGSATRIEVSNADGVAGSPTIDLSTVTQASSGNFVKVTLDGYGRVTGNTAVVAADITGLVDSTYVNVTGDTMSGALDMGTNKITNMGAPTSANDAATKNYVDSVAAGLSWKPPVNSVGATNPLTATTGDRFLNTTDYKIYTATATDTWDAGSAPADGWAVFDKATETGYVYPGTGAWVQFTGAGQIVAGTSLSKTGNTLNVNVGNGLMDDSDNLTVRLATGALSKTAGAGTNELALLLDGAGLEQSALGLKISAAGVTNAMLANSSITGDADDAGTGTVALGGTLAIMGTSAQGIKTAVAAAAGTLTFTLSAEDASSSQKGVASFDSGEFTVTAGNVVLKTNGIANSKLANSSVTFNADGATSSGAISLGGSLAISGSGAISTAGTANTITVSVATATTSVKGVASFADADFTVTAGEVTVDAKSLDWLTDVTITSAATGDMLVKKDSGDFVNRPVYHLHTQSSAATTWTVTHNLGQKYCNVTVVDASDEVVIPQSITFTNSTTLSVTFNASVAGKVVVMGVNSAA